MPPDFLALIEQSTEALVHSGIMTQSLKPGDPMPNFILPNAGGSSIVLQSLLIKGPVIISFFQGVWCPFCCLELMAWQEALPTIQALGATVVAISPQTLEYSQSTVEQLSLTYDVLSDRGNQVARQFGLVYQIPDYLHSIFAAMGHPLPLYNGDHSYELPLTGTFVVDQQGSVIYRFVDPDFTKRAEPADVIQVLRDLAVSTEPIN